MQPMTKEEAERFLKWNPKPWSDDYSAHYTTPCIVSNDKVRIRLKELLRYIAYLEQDRELLMDQIDKLVEANKLAVKQITQLDRGRERLEAEINNLIQTYKPSRLEIADHKGE